MTNEKAKEIIQSIKFILDSRYYSDEVEEALDLAIKGLDRQLCEDAISRQAVIDEMGDINMNILTIDSIRNGVILPKEYGRLIDADALDMPVNIRDGFEAMDYINGAEATIEADKEG